MARKKNEERTSLLEDFKIAKGKKRTENERQKKLRNAIKYAKEHKSGISIKITGEQKGRSKPKADGSRKALPPGWRISKHGRLYYEDRQNRSDRIGDKT
jgi:hypothetical protein